MCAISISAARPTPSFRVCVRMHVCIIAALYRTRPPAAPLARAHVRCIMLCGMRPQHARVRRPHARAPHALLAGGAGAVAEGGGCAVVLLAEPLPARTRCL